MARPYRHSSRRTQLRASGGQFRKTTLDDFGMGICPKCNAFTVQPPEPADMRVNGYIDPHAFGKWRNHRVCKQCGWDSTKPNDAPVSIRISSDTPEAVKDIARTFPHATIYSNGHDYLVVSPDKQQEAISEGYEVWKEPMTPSPIQKSLSEVICGG